MIQARKRSLRSRDSEGTDRRHRTWHVALLRRGDEVALQLRLVDPVKRPDRPVIAFFGLNDDEEVEIAQRTCFEPSE